MINKSRLNNVTFYCRDNHRDRNYEQYLKDVMKRLEEEFENPEYEFIGVYSAQDISGYCENRPQFQRMMEKARGRRADVIAAKGNCVSFYDAKAIAPSLKVRKFDEEEIKNYIYLHIKVIPLKQMESMVLQNTNLLSELISQDNKSEHWYDYKKFADCFVDYEERTQNVEQEDGIVTLEKYVVAAAIGDRMHINIKIDNSRE